MHHLRQTMGMLRQRQTARLTRLATNPPWVMHAGDRPRECPQIAAHEAAKVLAAARKAGCERLDKLKTIEDILQRLSTGVKGTGTRRISFFIATYTPKQAAEVVHHLSIRSGAAHARYSGSR